MRFLFVGCFKGQRTQPQVGVRKTLAFSCVMQRVYLSSHFVSFRNISQNCPMPSSPVNVTFCPSMSIRYCERVRSRGREPGGCLQTLAFFRATHYLSLRAKKRGPQKILLYFWGKGVCKHKTGNCRLRRLTGQKRSIRRVAISRKGNRIIKPTQDTFVLAWRKKAHTSIRVSIAASDNAISKVQCAP